ncbi:hypothetical protein FRC10_011751, partial [Ceratobasidium sp. 414]
SLTLLEQHVTMPINALVKTLLLPLANPNVTLSSNVFKVLPWMNNRFREVSGLKLLKPVQEDTNADDAGGDLLDEELQYVDVKDRFVLTEGATKALSAPEHAFFTLKAHVIIHKFLTEVQKLTQQQ